MEAEAVSAAGAARGTRSWGERCRPPQPPRCTWASGGPVAGSAPTRAADIFLFYFRIFILLGEKKKKVVSIVIHHRYNFNGEKCIHC